MIGAAGNPMMLAIEIVTLVVSWVATTDGGTKIYLFYLGREVCFGLHCGSGQGKTMPNVIL